MTVLRYAKNLTSDHLDEVLSGRRWPTEGLATRIPLDPVSDAVRSLGTDVAGTAIDRALVEPLHRALPMTRREAADPRVWQWLCVEQFPDLVWRRWSGQPPPPEQL